MTSPEGCRLSGGRIVELDPEDERWEPFVQGHPDGLVYHSPVWLKALAQEYSRRPLCLAFEDLSGGLRGILPLLSTKGLPLARSTLSSRRLSSLPRTPVAGPLALQEHVARKLVRAAIERVEAAGDARLELKVISPRYDAVVPGLRAVPWRFSYVVPLPSEPGLRPRAEWAFRRAGRLGVRVREASSEEDLRVWYQLYLETMRAHLLPARPFRFFDYLWKSMLPRGLMVLLMAEQVQPAGRVPLAGSLFFEFQSRVCCAFNGSRRDALHLHPNDAIHYHAIRRASQRGFQLYDLGEVPRENLGLARYKRKWGAEQCQLYRYYFPLRHEDWGGALGGRLRESIGGRVWRRLPLNLTARLGDAAFSYL